MLHQGTRSEINKKHPSFAVIIYVLSELWDSVVLIGDHKMGAQVHFLSSYNSGA